MMYVDREIDIANYTSHVAKITLPAAGSSMMIIQPRVRTESWMNEKPLDSLERLI